MSALSPKAASRFMSLADAAETIKNWRTTTRRFGNLKNVNSCEIGPSWARYRIKTPRQEPNPPQKGAVRRTLV
jgi:hypothetical protein